MSRTEFSDHRPLPLHGHEPVMLAETLHWLEVDPGKVIVDCTIGRAGHGRAIAEKLGEKGTLIGLDADPRNLEYASNRLKGIACQVRLFHANFSELNQVLSEIGISKVDGILADLGISTNQLFDNHYGLSFDHTGQLDMRLDPRLKKTAADLVNFLPEDELANVLYELAQERYSRRIARKIVEARRTSPIKTTEALAELARAAIGQAGRIGKIDPATRTFLALRMAVNREMQNLEKLLELGPAALHPGGRMAVMSFQSMEDRSVKQAFRSLEQTGVVTILTKKPLPPSDEEIAANPRARSAKLRVIERRS